DPHERRRVPAGGRRPHDPRPARLTTAPWHRLPGARAGGEPGPHLGLSPRGGGSASHRPPARRGQHCRARHDDRSMKARADVGICRGYLVVAAAFFKVAVLDAGTDRHDPAVAAPVLSIQCVLLLIVRVIRVPYWRRCAQLTNMIGLSLLGGHLQAIYFEVLALVTFVVCRSAWGVRTGGSATVIREPPLLAVAGG